MLARAIGSFPKRRWSACSVLQQVHQLHTWRLQLHNRPRGIYLPPDDTIGGSYNEKLAALTSISDDEVTLLKKKKPAPVCYAWCDPTPWMHVTQGISMTMNVNKLLRAGCKVKILMADWFARTDTDVACAIAHGGGDPSQVMRDICSYNVETWRAAGMDLDGVELVRLSDEISRSSDVYWPIAMGVARISDLGGVHRWLRVHESQDPRIGPNGFGSDGDDSDDPDTMGDFRAADMLRPFFQCAAMSLFQFQEKPDMWLLGLDQRMAYTLARQYWERVMRMDEDGCNNRPVALFHDTPRNLLEYPGSESFDPRWAIFMKDDEEDISRKMRNAFCPPQSAHNNPCLEYVKYVVLPRFGKFEVVRKEKDGGDKTFCSMEELTADYESGTLQPADVKQGLVNAINKMLRPVRDHFESSAPGKEIAKTMERFYVVE